jgi:UDP-3-O-[3-hydroxymyristoyl] N-acetylglucosamine deacetylase
MRPSEPGAQTTIAERVTLDGIGVHSGKRATLTIHPAGPNEGLIFTRVDLGDEIEIPARFENVAATELCTVLGDPRRGIATVEHVLAALRGCGIDNALIEVDGAEAPIMDGSAAPFVAAIERAGLRRSRAPRRHIKVLKPVRVALGASTAELLPHNGMRFEIEVDYDTPFIGRQMRVYDLDRESFRRDIAGARTFGFMRDVERLWAAGFARGAGLENTVVVGQDRILNPEGLRYADEFVRHKVLDAIGDLALAGAPLLGLYRAVRPGHKLNHAMLTALFADPSAWALVEAAPRTHSVAPSRELGRAELVPGLAAAALAPEV